MSKKSAAIFSGAVLAVSILAPISADAAPKGLCVGPAAGCYPTIQPALDAAADGDTIRISAGTFAGGLTITKSVRLLGAGQGVTVVRGGGPVVTIGDPSANESAQPTVAVARLTVTGGLTHGDGVVADGGGILIPPAVDGLGATVRLDHVSVVGNQANASETSSSPSGVHCPGGTFCPFAISRGGGIANFGTLHVSHSLVGSNRAAGIASDTNGGGIYSDGGTISLDDVLVTHNGSIATIPNGRFAEGGGLFVQEGQLSVSRSKINDNVASLTSKLPSFAGDFLIEQASAGGGVVLSDPAQGAFTHTKLVGNVSRAVDLHGEPFAIDGALQAGAGGLEMSDCLVSRNLALVIAKTSADVGSGGSALEADGAAFISHTWIVDNPSIARSPHGIAAVNAGVAVVDFTGDPQLVTLSDSVVSGNTALAESKTGSAVVHGAAFFNNSLLELRNVLVSRNKGTVLAPEATAQGGGIWNGIDFSGPPVTLTLRHSPIVGNSLSGSPGAVLQGGGVFTTEPVTIVNSPITANTPDQCFGCDAATRASPPRTSTLLPRTRY